MAKGWIVEIVKSSTGKVERTLGPFESERTAEKAERGVLINLNHEEYHTNVALNSPRSQALIDGQIKNGG